MEQYGPYIGYILLAAFVAFVGWRVVKKRGGGGGSGGGGSRPGRPPGETHEK